MHFARILRRAGFAIGPSQTMTAMAALEAVGIERREDVYAALHSVFVDRRVQSAPFRRAFEHFWRLDEQDEAVWPPSFPEPADENSIRTQSSRTMRNRQEMNAEEVKILENESWSTIEVLRRRDFDAMSAAERAEVRRIMDTLRLPIPKVRTRRFHPGPTGPRMDMRATLREMVRAGDVFELKRKQPIFRHPPLVVLCDISGSMASYARMLLHFLHVIANDQDRVHTFLFGTRLTNVSREMANRDPDIAVARVSQAAADWSGGTRIGEALSTFNRLWSRRVLGQGAIVLLITDGLDRDGGMGLSKEMERLQHSCRRLIWLNPLLRYDAFEPKSAGIRAMLPYVDDFRPVHNLDSLTSLIAALADASGRGRQMTRRAA
jgi:uncharacterized protein with von Willebrand factor type A (vWA) domain